MKNLFLEYCSTNKFQKKEEQIKTLDSIVSFYKQSSVSKNKFLNFFNKTDRKLGFYLYGGVGVGKTMLLDFFFDHLKTPKKRMHFNEFMIDFHDFRHDYKLQGRDNSIESFVKKLKKNISLIYLDEFQVTNIVDAMILGKLFEMIIKENILIVITSNTKIEDLYKDGLQRDQFLPFISLIKNFSIEHELIIDEDYRKAGLTKLERFFSPLNEKTNFKINQLFRELTKNKKPTSHKILVKGREFLIKSFYEGVAKFNFNELCDQNIGGEDYIQIAKNCNFITIEDVPNFTDENINMQQRFITLIDILYEKKIPLLISSNFNLSELNGSKRLEEPFKRTISRIYELTSPNIKIV